MCHNSDLMPKVRNTYGEQSFVDFWNGLFNGCFLNKGAGKFHVVLSNAGGDGICEFPLLLRGPLQSGGKCRFQISADGRKHMIAASDHGHASCQIAHHMVSCHTHARFIWINSEILFDNMFTSRNCYFDGSLHDGMNPLLDGPFYCASYQLLQMWLCLEQGQLKKKCCLVIEASHSIKFTVMTS